MVAGDYLTFGCSDLRGLVIILVKHLVVKEHSVVKAHYDSALGHRPEIVSPTLDPYNFHD